MPLRDRLPTLFIPHGGGPWPVLDVPFIPAHERQLLASYLRSIISSLSVRPRAVLVVSAHWEASVPTVQTTARPALVFDYTGYGPEAYELAWPAVGAPELAAETVQLLRDAGFPSIENDTRGYDHGVFIPMMLALPAADVPVFQVSLLTSLEPAQHMALGRALAPLRNQGVLIVGSGNSYHNMRGFGHVESTEPSRQFDLWLADAVTRPAAERERLLIGWQSAPAARACHPREEHLLPLHVIAGAALDDAGTLPLRALLMCTHGLAARFG